MTYHVPEECRVRTGLLGTSKGSGNNGLFRIKSPDRKAPAPLRVIISDCPDWEHVSVSLPTRCPTWDEMCHIKSLFWDEDDCVMQLHPPKSEWVNNHPYCLHLWRPKLSAIPTPPSFMVGYKDLGILNKAEPAYILAAIAERLKLDTTAYQESFPVEVPVGYKLLKDTTHAERSWDEDKTHENGNYNCICCHCGRIFTGHKRRVICKACITDRPGTPMAPKDGNK